MQQGDHGAGPKADILKPEPDINQHAQSGDKHRNNGIRLHLTADGRADGFRGNLLCIYLEIFYHSALESFSFVGVQGTGLENHLIGSLHLLCLNISVSCNVFDQRHCF